MAPHYGSAQTFADGTTAPFPAPPNEARRAKSRFRLGSFPSPHRLRRLPRLPLRTPSCRTPAAPMLARRVHAVPTPGNRLRRRGTPCLDSAACATPAGKPSRVMRTSLEPNKPCPRPIRQCMPDVRHARGQQDVHDCQHDVQGYAQPLEAQARRVYRAHSVYTQQPT